MNLESVASDLRRRYKRDVLWVATENPLQMIPTGIPTLDFDLGGGIALGRQILITGKESSGKTSLGITLSIEAIKRGFEVIWVDTERSFDKNWAESLGLTDYNNFYLMEGVTGERVFMYVRDIMKATENDKVFFVLDSIASMVPEQDLENTAGVAPGARLVNRAIRVWNCLQGRLHGLVLINQERDTLGQATALPHGKAQIYHASQWIRLRSGGWLSEKKDEILGIEIKWRVQKSKVAPPFSTGAANFWFDGGYDKLDSLLTVGSKLKIIKQSGAYYYFGDESIQGRAKAIAYLTENPELAGQYFNEVYNQMQHKIYRNGDETGA
jgi:recombination protein RecA